MWFLAAWVLWSCYPSYPERDYVGHYHLPTREMCEQAVVMLNRGELSPRVDENGLHAHYYCWPYDPESLPRECRPYRE